MVKGSAPTGALAFRKIYKCYNEMLIIFLKGGIKTWEDF